MKAITTLSVAATIALAAQFAFAQGMGMGAPNFAAIDADSNGELTAEELAALPFVQNGNAQADQILTQWDSDSSGTVSEEEFNNRPAMGMGMGMGMGG